MGSLARFSLSNRALVALATILAVLGGTWATATLEQELIPSLDLPIVGAVTSYPGASPEVVEQQVTDPIEQAAGVVSGLEGTSSTASANLSVVMLELEYGTDVTNAQQEFQAAISRLSAVLPDSADTRVISGGVDDLPVVQLSATTDADEDRTVDLLRTVVVPEIERIDGVRDVQLSGVRDEQVTVDLDLTALAATGVTPDAVSSLLQANGIVVPGGSITEDGRTLSVETGERITSAADIAALPVAVTEAGPVRLDDVADVTAEPVDATSFTRTDGRDAFGLAVTKTPDGNTVSISEAVQERLAEFESILGADAEMVVVFDQAPFIQQSVEDLTVEGLLGLVFAVVVILLFLRKIRPTAVTAVSIPLSLVVALIGLKVVGFSLNLFTLAALTVSIGRVVDDSIVVIENINRHLSYGKDRRTAILDAVREVAGAITSATIATAAVFVPIGLVSGMVGELFRPFAFTVALALLASLLVALTIVPVIAYWFLRPANTGTDAAAVREAAEAEERRGLLQRSYVTTLRGAVRRPWLTVLVAVGIFAGTLGLATQLETEFIGDTGQNTLSVTQSLPAGTSLAAADEAAAQVEDVIGQLDDVTTYQVTGGAGDDAMAFFGMGGDTSFAITLDLEADAVAAEAELRDRLAELEDAGDLTVSAGMAGFAGGLEVIVSGADGQDVSAAAETVLAAVHDLDGTTDVASNLAADLPTLRVDVDRAAAAAAGTSEAQVGGLVSAALRGSTIGAINTETGRSDVVLRAGQQPLTVTELEALPVTTAAGTVPLAEVATVEEVAQPVSITRANGLRSASITASTTVSDLGAVTADLRSALDGLDLPDGVAAEIGGVSADQDDAFANLGLALLLAIAIVYLVMVATFNSLAQPLILLISVPFAATGAIALLLVTSTPLGVAALIGALMLVGVVVTNAIVLIDLVNQYRRQGMSIVEAIEEGGRHRLAPILMTAAATIAALTPMALGLTGGSAFISQPLALVVIGGLVTSTFLTLLLVPVLYLLVERRALRRVERREARQASRRPVVAASTG